jgi:uncharacterized membrane protein YbhN (UPF0104 family)
MPKQFKNIFKLFIKLAVTVVCLWYVSKKIDWQLTLQLLKQSNKWWLVAAAVLFIFSKMVSAARLNLYFKCVDVYLTEKSNLKLYWLGMFYNLFLPGGIGGDAYKVVLLNREKKGSVKLLSAAVLLDRVSGVVGLGILAAIYFFIISTRKNTPTFLLVSVIPALILYYLGVKKIFPSFLAVFSPTLLLGLLVQASQVLCAYCIMASIQINDHQSAYIFIFLLSSIVAILPFTIGGLGAREVVFLWGSSLFLLDKHQSVYISILFYLITLSVSFAGLRWNFSPQIISEDDGFYKTSSREEGEKI